jgi:hypothetical protein
MVRDLIFESAYRIALSAVERHRLDKHVRNAASRPRVVPGAPPSRRGYAESQVTVFKREAFVMLLLLLLPILLALVLAFFAPMIVHHWGTRPG